MKRDRDLLWTILGLLEASEGGYDNDDSIGRALAVDHPSLTFETIRHHLSLLGDKGYAVFDSNGYWRITDAGHDAYEAGQAGFGGGTGTANR